MAQKTVGTEVLYFPETPLDLSFDDNDLYPYRLFSYSGAYVGDPSIRLENVAWWADDGSFRAAGKPIARDNHSWCGVGIRP